MSCKVCGWPASCYITDGPGSTRAFCRRHCGEVDAQLAEAVKLAPRTAPGLKQVWECEQCGRRAAVHVTTGPIGAAGEQHLCESCGIGAFPMIPRHLRS